MLSYIWPKDNRSVRRRVIYSLGLLVAAKTLNVQVVIDFLIDFELENWFKSWQTWYCDSSLNVIHRMTVELTVPVSIIESSFCKFKLDLLTSEGKCEKLMPCPHYVVSINCLVMA